MVTKLMTVPEVSEALHVTQATIRRYVTRRPHPTTTEQISITDCGHDTPCAGLSPEVSPCHVLDELRGRRMLSQD
jgi:predicted transcriptional regulator